MRVSFCAIAASLIFFPVAAAAQNGDNLLRQGLAGRVTELSDGIVIKRNANGKVDAGYFLIRVIDNNLPDSQVCPKVAFTTTRQGKQWRKLNDKLYDTIFDRKGLWGINARFLVSNPLNATTGQEIRLVSVKRPEKGDCGGVSLLGQADELVNPASYVFPTPINYRDNIFGTIAEVRLRSVHQLEANSDRVNELWKGIGLFAGFVAAPLAPLVESMSGIGKEKISDALTIDGGESSGAPIQFNAQSSDSRTKSVFVYLGFSAFGQTQAPLKGGVTIKGDYLASVYAPQQYFSEISAPSPSDIKKARVFLGVGGARQTIFERVGAAATNLLEASTTDAFSGVCKTMRPALLALGLSEVDTDGWLWAMAADSSHAGVSGKVDAISCFDNDARGNLARLKITITSVPETTKATLAQMHDAMLALTLIMGQEGVSNNVAAGFADQINLILGDDDALSLIGGEASGPRPRSEVLDILRTKFVRGGCWAPRLGRDTLDLTMRPNFAPLPDKARAGAMLALASDNVTPFILSLGFDPVVKNQAPLISAIGIQTRGKDEGKVVQELTVDRRPGNCEKPWMDPVFEMKK